MNVKTHSLIPDAALNQHIAILGKTGSGKTYAAKTVVEHLLNNDQQVCVIDPTSAWWGIGLTSKGKPNQFPIALLGGSQSDIPLFAGSGEAVAKLVTTKSNSFVLDTSDLTVGEYTRWFTDFASTLLRTITHPLHLIIDEAHYFMPQGKVPDPQAGKMLHSGNRLMSSGRSRGIRATLITQRPAKLHKDALTCADTLVALRVIAPQDRKAIKEWIDGCAEESQGNTVLQSLAGLSRGEAWVWYPEGKHLVKGVFPKIHTFDSSKTPEVGASIEKPKFMALEEIRKALAEQIEEIKQQDPTELKKQIARLQRELDQRKPEVKVERVPFPSKEQTDRILQETEKIIVRISSELANSKSLFGRETALLNLMRKSPEKRDTESNGQIPNKLPKAESRILSCLVQQARPLSKRRLAVLCGYSANGGGFNNALSGLRTRGLIEGKDTFTAILPRAEEFVTSESLPRKGKELLDWWVRHPELGKAERTILKWMEQFNSPVTKETLAQHCGYASQGGGFNNALSKLRTLGLITGSQDITLTEELQC